MWVERVLPALPAPPDPPGLPGPSVSFPVSLFERRAVVAFVVVARAVAAVVVVIAFAVAFRARGVEAPAIAGVAAAGRLAVALAILRGD